jgi:uncharacterized protein (DUF2267 family)
VNYEEFLEFVQKRGHRDRQTAVLATRATLGTLAKRISPGERAHLARLLPPELRPPIISVDGPREVFHLPDFCRLVSQQEGLPVPVAEEHARTVFAALGIALDPDQLEHVATELTPDFEPLLAEARSAREEAARARISATEYLSRVARRAGLDQDGARRATEAVLETLAERISGDEVDALLEWLPPELHAPFLRGRERTNGIPRDMSVDEFDLLVAEREGTTRQLAHAHARAEFTTLREAVPEREFTHLERGLPADFVQLIPDP